MKKNPPTFKVEKANNSRQTTTYKTKHLAYKKHTTQLGYIIIYIKN